MDLITKSTILKQANITIAYADIEPRINSELTKLQRNLNLPGFRKGKIPLTVVKKKYFEDILQQEALDALNSKIRSVVVANSLTLCSHAKIADQTKKPDNSIEFVVNFEIFPEIELPELANKSLEQLESTVTEDDKTQLIEDLRRRLARDKNDWAKSTSGAKLNSLIDFDATITDSEATISEFKNKTIELTDNCLGFLKEQLLGKKAKAVVEFDFNSFPVHQFDSNQFDADSLVEDATDNTAPFKYKVTINKVSNLNLPKLDHKFYEAYGIKGGADAFNKKISSDMQRYLRDKLHEINFATVQQFLLKECEFELAESAIEEQIKLMQRDIMHQYKNQKMPLDLPLDLPAELFRKPAENSLRNSLIFNKIVKNNLEVSQDDIDKELDLIASEYEDTDKFKQAFKQDKNKMSNLNNKLLEMKVLAVIVSQCSVKLENKSYFDLFKSQ